MSKSNLMALQNGSDIRGVALPDVPGEKVNLDKESVGRIASGFLEFVCEKTGRDAGSITISIGRDPRLSGGDIQKNFSEILTVYGVRVLDCGLASTPAMFYSTIFPETNADAAVMITASHLPFNRNGMKFFLKEGGLDKSDIKEILRKASEKETLPDINSGQKQGNIVKTALMDLYTKSLRELIKSMVPGEKPLSGLKIAVDAGNGAGGFYATEVLEPLGADISASCLLEPDGHFPNHVPNPENEEAMRWITNAVLEGGCDLGLIFDTDVDRSSAVDEKGRAINRNGIVAMAAALVADEYPGSCVVTDSITSNELNEFLEDNLGLKHLRFKRGYRNVINKSVELNKNGIDSCLAIETSGHAAYRDNHFLDDGAYLATRIVIRAAVLKNNGRAISSVIEGLKEPCESYEVRMPIRSDDFSAAGNDVIEMTGKWVNEHSTSYSASICSGNSETVTPVTLRMEVVEPNYEGIRVSLSGAFNGWFLLRKSLHDPIMPLNIETDIEGGTRQVAKILIECLDSIDHIDCSALNYMG